MLRRTLWMINLFLIAFAIFDAFPHPMSRSVHAQAELPNTVYFPVITAGNGGEGSATATPTTTATAMPTPTPDGSQRIFGWVGRLRSVEDRLYATYFTPVQGGEYAVVGETPDIETSLATFAARRPPIQVQLWGVIQPPIAGESERLIVVTGILPGNPVTDVGADEAPIAVVQFDLVNLHAGPGSNFATTGQVVRNQVCEITGSNQRRTWWQLACADNAAGDVTGWIDARLVSARGNVEAVPVVDTVVIVATPTPVAQATPTPTPLPTTAPSLWRVSMYNNAALQGNPVVVTSAASVDFDWGTGSPSSVIPADNFSIRFERTINFTAGFYQFIAEADDGIRVWFDGQILIDEWHGTTSRRYSVSRNVTGGPHTIVVEYYEASGLASVRFQYELFTQSPDWSASYFRNTSLTGPAVITQDEPRSINPLDYNWAGSSPFPNELGTDFWSARWVGAFYFESGTFAFRVQADDGVRVYLDGLLVIDRWVDGYKEAGNRVIGVGNGLHTVTVEFYERTGNALIRLWWFREVGVIGPQRAE